MQSSIVVISWWSNCLGLTCLHNLVEHTTNRNIYIIQFGKEEKQRELFRYYMPNEVIELDYDYNRCTEEWYVREVLARDILGDHEGLWFVDHDCFMLEDCDEWLSQMDSCFSQSNICFSHPLRNHSEGITQPAFWLSPARLPQGMPSFSPVPTKINPRISNFPFLSTISMPSVAIPEKDTLVVVGEYLQQFGMVSQFSLSTWQKQALIPGFPRHKHIGGLYIFTYQDLPPDLNDWFACIVDQFNAFYAACPPQWRSVECPELRRRVKQFAGIAMANVGTQEDRLV